MLRGIVVDYAGVLTEPDAGRLLAALETARSAGVRTALLSNAEGGGPVRRRLASWFDALVFSGEAGVAKPDAAAFRLVAARLDLPTASCVFVDDAAGNVAGAVAAGMVGVHHVSVRETLAELAALFPGVVETSDAG
ncbi:HAD superfamily hydrolase (TIGR01509 family) [Prauserella shujinwangii]|uniref:HAD superfamily hydrolase (TIGR01509 family) n=1 Tax=Prauserella shujinwangii TaxID=1453103 RepID=A0A2T0LY69_9PSEU|nr:HAD-IA family hydrolase [Prauserella shujinwangii]PRX49059.1 HAD superfamily hydrolase (TIGR01509 family) [Prauserella shujinwangii]